MGISETFGTALVTGMSVVMDAIYTGTTVREGRWREGCADPRHL
jgi:hypothetical protein